jgi:hypothetical protein
MHATDLRPALTSPDPAGGHRIPGKGWRRAVVFSCAAATCVLLVAACGSAGAHGATTGSPRLSGGQPTAACPACGGVDPGGPIRVGPSTLTQVSLDVTIYPADNGTPYSRTLRCDPDGGTVPDPVTACAQLLADPGLLSPQPLGHAIACPMIMTTGRAVVDGTYLGRQVHEIIVDGGCDLQRWAELMQIFPPTSSDLQPVNPGYPVLPGRA